MKAYPEPSRLWKPAGLADANICTNDRMAFGFVLSYASCVSSDWTVAKADGVSALACTQMAEAIKDHSVAIRGHSVAIRGHSVANRGHSVAIRGSSVANRKQLEAHQRPSEVIRGPSVANARGDFERMPAR